MCRDSAAGGSCWDGVDVGAVRYQGGGGEGRGGGGDGRGGGGDGQGGGGDGEGGGGEQERDF